MSAINLSLRPSIDLTVSITCNKPRNLKWVVINEKWIAEAKTGSVLRFQHIGTREEMKFTAGQINKLGVTIMYHESNSGMIKDHTGKLTEISFSELRTKVIEVTYPEQCDAQHKYHLEIDTDNYLFKGELKKQPFLSELSKSQRKVHSYLHEKLKTLMRAEAQVMQFDSKEWKPSDDDQALSDAILTEILGIERKPVLRLSKQIHHSTDSDAFAACVDAIKYEGFYRILRTVLERSGYEFDSACATIADGFAKAAVQQMKAPAEDSPSEEDSTPPRHSSSSRSSRHHHRSSSYSTYSSVYKHPFYSGYHSMGPFK